MPFIHCLLALLVVAVWGVNFMFVKLGLQEMTPLLLCALRFILASIPGVFFIKRPAVPFKIIALYGLLMFDMQFGLLFLGMYLGMTPGMTSLIMQVQVFFSMFFAYCFLKETANPLQILGAVIAFIGIVLVAFHFDHAISLAGFVCILGAAATWGVGNLITRQVRDINMMALVVWGSLVAAIPMSILTLCIDGVESIHFQFEHVTLTGIVALLYIVYASTWLGYGLWNWLLSRYTISMVVPFTLLVPVFGMISSMIIFHESLEPWKAFSCALVIVGLCIHLLSSRIMQRYSYRSTRLNSKLY